jgi:hypothetical protein
MIHSTNKAHDGVASRVRGHANKAKGKNPGANFLFDQDAPRLRCKGRPSFFCANRSSRGGEMPEKSTSVCYERCLGHQRVPFGMLHFSLRLI